MEQQDNYAYKEARERVKRLKGFYIHLAVFVVINSFILVNVYVRTLYNDETFWQISTFFTLIFWGIGLVFHAFGVFAKELIFTKEWEQRKLKEFMDKEN
ncbi:2TM domain-containing protein [Ascidiimonas sp. W6]|uniref:2TM domain-containing protein n=1 Tax=Ascidiimonas meishanensis TaxID=3128903 RepID=UPI0030EEA736